MTSTTRTDSTLNNIYPIKTKVSQQQRQKLMNQDPIVIWFTGLSGSGKSTLAVQLEAQRQGVGADEALASGESKVPLGRYAKPEEIADVALFLASQRASYVTGALIPMDGASTPLI